MGVLTIADFHYGAFLSALLNYGKKKPSLFDKSESNALQIPLSVPQVESVQEIYAASRSAPSPAQRQQ